MIRVALYLERRLIEISWPEGGSSLFPFIRLRDNNPKGFHPQTLERHFDITSVDILDTIDKAEVSGNTLELHWQQE